MSKRIYEITVDGTLFGVQLATCATDATMQACDQNPDLPWSDEYSDAKVFAAECGDAIAAQAKYDVADLLAERQCKAHDIRGAVDRHSYAFSRWNQIDGSDEAWAVYRRAWDAEVQRLCDLESDA